MTAQQLVSTLNLVRSRREDCSQLESVLFKDASIKGKLSEALGGDACLVLGGIALSLSEYQQLLERALEETIVQGVTFK